MRRLTSRVDYAPSRIAYRINRMWLSPLTRVLVLWVLPLGLMSLAAYSLLQMPRTQAQLATLKTELNAKLRSQPDFQVPLMEVRGASPSLTGEIHRAIDVNFPISVLDLPLEDIRDKVVGFDAVKSVSVQVTLGGPLVLTVTQREPVAVWRHHGGLELVDIEGHRVAVTDKRMGAADLPLIAAEGAPKAVPEALALHAAAAPIADRVRGLVRQGARRWDLHLTNGQIIQLPETDAVSALQRVVALHEAGNLFGRDITVVDMRNPQRPSIRLGENAFGYLRQVRALEQGLLRQRG